LALVDVASIVRTIRVRALTIERHEAWLEDHRYLNMDLLKEHKKQAMRQAA
jgi:putative transposase